MRTVSSDMLEELYSSETDTVYHVLLEIDHDDLATPLRIVNNVENVVSNGNTYYAYDFKFILPKESDGEISNAQINIDGVDRTIIDIVRSISSPATVTASIVRNIDPDTVEIGPFEFTLRNVSWNASRVTGDLIWQTYGRDNISVIKYTNALFPGLYG